MIGVTGIGRALPAWMGWPAVFPALCENRLAGHRAKFNHFKYNLFPVNGACQSSLVARALQQTYRATCAREGPPEGTWRRLRSSSRWSASRSAHMPSSPRCTPTFRRTAANWCVRTQPQHQVRPAAARQQQSSTRPPPDAPRNFRTTIITNASPASAEVVAHVTDAGANCNDAAGTQ